jgi:hypothetical protein
MSDSTWVVPPLDDLMDVHMPWGRCPPWKAKAMCLAYTQIAIADAAALGDQPRSRRPAAAARG